MLTITIPAKDLFNESTSEFISVKETILDLEHSLISISKWEQKFHKPFLSREAKTHEEIIHYIKCMTINKNVDPNVYYALTKKNIDEIKAYIDDPMTATRITSSKANVSREIITSEIIYFWMIEHDIPHQFERWHINRLLTLIRVCNEKSKSTNKMSKKDIMNQNRTLNEQRRKMCHSTG